MPEMVQSRLAHRCADAAWADEIVEEESHMADALGFVSPRQSCSGRAQRSGAVQGGSKRGIPRGVSKSGDSVMSSVRSSGSATPRSQTATCDAVAANTVAGQLVDSSVDSQYSSLDAISAISSMDDNAAVPSVSSSCERAEHAALCENDCVEVDDSTLMMYDYCEEDAKVLQQSRARDQSDEIAEEIDVLGEEPQPSAIGQPWHGIVAMDDGAGYDSYDESVEEGFHTPRISPIRERVVDAATAADHAEEAFETVFDEISAHLQFTADHPYLCMREQERAMSSHRNMRHMEFCAQEARAQEISQYDKSILIKVLVGEAHRHQARQCASAYGNSWSAAHHRAGWKEIASDVERTLLMEGPLSAQRRISCMCVFNPRKTAPPEIDGGDDERLRRMERQEQVLQQMYHQRVLGGNPLFLESSSLAARDEGACTPHPFARGRETYAPVFSTECNKGSPVTIGSYDDDDDGDQDDDNDSDGDGSHDDEGHIMYHERKQESCYSSNVVIPCPSYASKHL